jgi:hypothetical protein
MRAKTIVSIILYVVFAVAIAVAAVFLIRFLSNDQKLFSVRYGAADYTGNVEVTVMENEYNIFNCNYLLDSGGNRGYSPAVVPNPDAPNFSFTVDGDEYRFLGKMPELTDCFIIMQYPDSFSLFIPSGTSVKDILQAAFPGKAIAAADTDLAAMTLDKQPYFRLSVKSYNKQETVNIHFKTAQRGRSEQHE